MCGCLTELRGVVSGIFNSNMRFVFVVCNSRLYGFFENS